MSPRRIFAILIKDLRDAARDGRILVLLALPIGMAVFYNATIGDDDELPETKVAVVESGGGAIARELRKATDKTAKLKVQRVSSAQSARERVAKGDVDVAVVAREAAAAGTPSALVLVGQDASATAQSVVALVPDALTRAAGKTPSATATVNTVPPSDQKPYEILEQRSLAVLMVIILLIAFVAMMVVPMQTAEELEKGTYGALRLAVTGPEILAAKAIAGYLYSILGVAATLLLTKLDIADPLLFGAATLALTVSLVGFGLMLGLLLPNSNAINSYGAFFLFPLIIAGGAVFFVDSGVALTLLDCLPFSQAAKLLGDALSSETPFDAGIASWLVIGVWAVLGYALLARISTRREL
jgi:hypothetical protein